MTERRSFSSYCTDERSTSPLVSLLVTVSYAVLALAVALSTDPGTSLLGVALGGAAAALIQWPLLRGAQRLALGRTWFRHHTVISMVIVVIVVMVSGALVMAATAARGNDVLAAMNSSESVLMWLGRAAILLFVTAGWSALDDFRTGLTHLQEIQEQLIGAKKEGVRRVVDQRREVIDQILAMLKHVLIDESEAQRPELLTLARDGIRPLSHELASELPVFEPERPGALTRTPWRRLVDEVTSRPLISPLLMAVTVTVMFIARTVSPAATPPENAAAATLGSSGVAVSVDVASLLGSLIYLLAVFLATWVAGIVAVRVTGSRLPALPTGRRLVLIVVTLVVMGIVVQIVVSLSAVVPGVGSDGQSTFLRDLLVTIPILVIALLILVIRSVAELFTAVTRKAEDANRDLAWEVARVNETLLQERRFLATAVHGPVQSAVASAGLALGQLVADGVRADRAWAQARERIASVVAGLADGPPRTRDLLHELQEVSGTWAGVCDVRVEIDDEAATLLALDWVCAGTVSDLVTEAVANAAMHGRAEHVDVRIRQQEDAVLAVLVRDDGVAEPSSASAGLGSQLLDEVAIAWSRTLTPQGSTVEVLLPTAA